MIGGPYDPKTYEEEIWKFWQENDLFSAKTDSDKPPFTILMPPPNVTSQLHMGHGTGYTIQDLIIRWKRMSGFNALWLPGTDHAGIATQMMVEKDLEKQGLSRKELGREKFVSKLEAWKDKYGSMILKQFEKLGFSCDWKRVAYTMDPQLSQAVRHVFVSLYNEGLIYRSERLVNWDTVLQTAVSDDEVQNIEINGHLWHIKYPITNTDDFIIIATTRPETMLGDTAIAVNPEDERYKHLIGKTVSLPLTDRQIPIIADPYVKMDFGTGALKITPAHDTNDFEIGKRHDLPFISILSDDGKVNSEAPESFVGLDRSAARKKVLKELRDRELLAKEEPYKHTVPHSERSKTVIEPKLSMQWYVKMSSLAKPAAESARSGKLHFYPSSWNKTYLYWLDNIQDWCISRQLWWGHRIPIWYCGSCRETMTSMEDLTECSQCSSKNIVQDPDVLDTWFSSWLWPLSPFGWPKDNEETKQNLEAFHPSNVLVTAPEIIFLWVARMNMASLKFTGKDAFNHIYFNATVCDKQGRKFSKTLGNGIEPIEMIDLHGADAVRFTAVTLASLGGRTRMAKTDFETGAKFINKIWNASRFLLQQCDQDTNIKPIAEIEPNLAQKWLITQLSLTAKKVNKLISSYRVNEAVDAIYHYFWNDLCDWGIESEKENLKGELKNSSLSILIYALEGALRMAHPVIPFITEKIWLDLPVHPDWDRGLSISTASYPQENSVPQFSQESNLWDQVQELVSEVRSLRGQATIPPKLKLDAYVQTKEKLQLEMNTNARLIKKLAGLASLTVKTNLERPEKALTGIGKEFQIFLPIENHLDLEKERSRLESEKIRIQKIVTGLEKKLKNQSFMDRAPQEIRDSTQSQFENLTNQIEKISANLNSLQ